MSPSKNKLASQPQLKKIYHQLRQTPSILKPSQAYTFTTQLILQTAAELKINIKPIPDSNIIQLEHNGEIRYFNRQTPSQLNTALSQDIVNNKQTTKHFLSAAGISIPLSFLIKRKDPIHLLKNIYNSLKKPLVVKPVNESHGTDVIINIRSWSNFREEIAELFSKHRRLMVEEMMPGNEYRLTTTSEKLLAVTQRVPAHVVGDGRHTLRELIKMKNVGRSSDLMTGNLVQIELDKISHDLIAKQNVGLDQTIRRNRVIQLKKVSNISVGGDCIDWTPLAHPSLTEIALKTMRAIPGLHFAGLDLICQDITQPLSAQIHGILEINDSPGFSIAQFPSRGDGQPVAEEFLKMLFQ